MNAKTAATEGAAPADKPRVRDRILDAACDLFYRHGIRAVGVDAIASEAGTNKMSFYRSFPSKDDLAAEYLTDQEREYWARWDETIAPYADDPRRQVEALVASRHRPGLAAREGDRGLQVQDQPRLRAG